MSVTNKGKGWETRNSLWLIWVFVMLFNWIAFFWIGGRAKQRKWVLFGCLYLVLCFVVPFVAVEVFKDNEITDNIFFGTFFIAWIASIIHAFLSRREYLIRREEIVDNQEAANAAYRQQIQNRYPQQFGYPQQQGYPQQNAYPPAQQNVPPVNQPPHLQQNYTQPPMQPPAPVLQASQPPVQKINLNAATEQQLASLPGVGVALAKRAVELRSQTIGFASVQDFNQRLGLMPHFAVQIENLAFVEPPQAKTPPNERSSRVIDI